MLITQPKLKHLLYLYSEVHPFIFMVMIGSAWFEKRLWVDMMRDGAVMSL